MPLLDEAGLRSRIKNSDTVGIYLIFGDEPYLKKRYVEQLISTCVDEQFADFNLHRYENGTSVDEIISVCETLPVFSVRSCVVLHDVVPADFSEKDFEELLKMLSDLPDSTVLIMWFDAYAVPDKPSGRIAKLIKLFSGSGVAAELKKRTGSSLLRPLISHAQKNGCSLDTDTARYLVAAVGDDCNTLLNEIDKLCHFVGRGMAITSRAIDTACAKSLDASAFDLARAILVPNAEKAFVLLDKMFTMKVDPSMIMGALISVYVDMYRAKVSLANGHQTDYLAGAFKYGNREFRLRNGARDSSKISVQQLRECLNVLADADYSIKTEFGDASGDRLAIEKAIVRLILATSRG